MASLRDTLELFVTVNTNQGISSLESFASKTEAATKKAGSSISTFQSLASKALTIGAAGMGVGGLLTSMASKDEAAAGQLKAAIGQVGQSYSDYTERVDKAVDSMAHFGHTDDEVNNALATLTLATGDTGKALDLMQVAADYAARKHIDLATAATSIGKIFNGATKPLKEFGIQVKVNADGTKDYAGAVGEMGDILQGQASAGADTFNGKMKELAARAENFVSDFGQNFGPAILGASTVMTAFGAVTQGVTGILERHAIAKGSVTLTSEADTAAIAEETAATATLGTVTEAMTTKQAAAEAARIQSILTGEAYVSTEAEVAAAQQARAAAEAKLLLSNDALIASEEELAAATDAVTVAEDGAGASSLTLTAALGPIGIGAAALAGTYAVLGDKADYVTGMFGMLHGGLIDTNDVLSSMGVVGAGASAVLDHFSDKSLQGSVSVGVLNTKLMDTPTGVQALNEALKNTDGTEKQTVAIKAMSAALDQAKAKAQALADQAAGAPNADIAKQRADIAQQKAIAGVSDAQKALNDAQASGDPKAIAAAQRDLDSANLDVKSSTLDAADAAAKLSEAQDAMFNHIDTATEKAQKEHDALYLYSLGIGNAAPAMQPYIDQLQKVIDLQQQIAGTAFGTYDPGTQSRDDSGHISGARASGGRVTAGRAYVIGEKRSEIMVPDQSGYVLPDASAAMAQVMNAAGGATSAGDTIHIHGVDAVQVVNELERRKKTSQFLSRR